ALTECCRLLAIDGKTLRGFLAQAQLPVQAHPSDARCKGLSSEHLLLLATAHHRRLAALPEDRPAPARPSLPHEPLPLPQDLLDLLAKLSDLPAQVAALQQQLTALTQLMPHAAASPSPGLVLAAEPALTSPPAR